MATYTKAELQPYITKLRNLKAEERKAKAETVKAYNAKEKAEERYHNLYQKPNWTAEEGRKVTRACNIAAGKHMRAYEREIAAGQRRSDYEQYLRNNRIYSAVERYL